MQILQRLNIRYWWGKCGVPSLLYHLNNIRDKFPQRILRRMLALPVLLQVLEPLSAASSEFRLLNAQFTLQFVCSFPFWVQQELLKLFSPLFLQRPGMGTPAPVQLSTHHFQRRLHFQRLPSLKTYFRLYSPLLPPSIFVGYFTGVCVCVSKNFPEFRLRYRDWDDWIWDFSFMFMFRIYPKGLKL